MEETKQQTERRPMSKTILMWTVGLGVISTFVIAIFVIIRLSLNRENLAAGISGTAGDLATGISGTAKNSAFGVDEIGKKDEIKVEDGQNAYENKLYNTNSDVTTAPRNTNTSNSASFPMDEKKTIEESLLDESEKLNKELPKMVSEFLEETTVSVSGKEVTVSYRSTDNFAVITQSLLDREFKKRKIDEVCNVKSYRYYLEKGATFILKYYNNNGRLGGTIIVKLSDCM